MIVAEGLDKHFGTTHALRGLDLDVVAEGVETRAQADILAANGCEFAQGYLFGRPADAGDLDVLARPQRARRRKAVRRKR